LLRPVIQNWNRDITGLLVRKYNELLAKVEQKVREGVEFNYSSLDEEIEETEARLQDLYARRRKITEATKSSESVSTLLQTPLGQRMKVDLQEEPKPVSVPEEPEPAPAATTPKSSAGEGAPSLDQVTRKVPTPDKPQEAPVPPQPVASAPSVPKTIMEGGKEIPVVQSRPLELTDETKLQTEKPTGRVSVDQGPPVRTNQRFRGPQDRGR